MGEDRFVLLEHGMKGRQVPPRRAGVLKHNVPGHGMAPIGHHVTARADFQHALQARSIGAVRNPTGGVLDQRWQAPMRGGVQCHQAAQRVPTHSQAVFGNLLLAGLLHVIAEKRHARRGVAAKEQPHVFQNVPGSGAAAHGQVDVPGLGLPTRDGYAALGIMDQLLAVPAVQGWHGLHGVVVGRGVHLGCVADFQHATPQAFKASCW